MSLPIVIIFERHWDVIPKLVTKSLLPDLAKQGYDTLCFEYPPERSEAEIRESHQAGLELDSKIHDDAQMLLRKAKIITKLSEMNLSSLACLMQLFVSSKRYFEVAEKIRGLPASRIVGEIFDDTRKLSVALKGVDVDREPFNKMMAEKVNRMSIIREIDPQRIKAMFKNLLKLKRERNGVVFVCGAYHAKRLLAKFAKKGMKDDILYYFPHSSSLYDSSFDDIRDSLNRSPALREHEFILSKHHVKPFVTSIMKDVIPKISYQQEIAEENTHILFLSDLFKAKFKAFLRPGYHVDALVDTDETPHIEEIEKGMDALGVETRHIAMKGHKYLVVPSVNTREVALKIRS